MCVRLNCWNRWSAGERVCEIIAEGTDEPITFKRYPKEKEWLLTLRERVNAEIEKAIVKQ